MQSGVEMFPAHGGPPLTLEDDGRINVKGLGYITRAWSTKIDQWKDLITKCARKNDIPEAWIASFMLQESGGNPKACSPCSGKCCGSTPPGCCAYGLMQMIQSTGTKYGVTGDNLYDPEMSIDGGSKLLADLARKLNWNPVHVAATYVAGGVYKYTGKNCPKPGLWNINEHCGYSESIVRGINAAIEAGYSGTGASEQQESESWIGWNLLLAAACTAVPLGVLMYTGAIRTPKFARKLIPARNPATKRSRYTIEISGGRALRHEEVEAIYERGPLFVFQNEPPPKRRDYVVAERVTGRGLHVRSFKTLTVAKQFVDDVGSTSALGVFLQDVKDGNYSPVRYDAAMALIRGWEPTPAVNPVAATWRDYIQGEWWLLPDGTVEFADQDTGDVPGHAALAQDAMLNRDVLVEGLIGSGVISEDAAEYLETASQVLAEYERSIPDELGASAVIEAPIRRRIAWGSNHLWRDIKKEPELTYMECWGAIRVAGRAFQAHHFTSDSIKAMQDFLLDQFSEGDNVQPDRSKIVLEDMSGHYAELPIAEFLTIKHAREIFG